MSVIQQKLSFISLACALMLFPVVSSVAQDIDPCDNISGKWAGITTGYKCTWDATAEFIKYKSTIRMNYHLKPRSRCGDELDIIYSGTCRHAYLKLEANVIGTIFGDSIFLRDADGTEVNLKKQ
ncbi:hypothetical protein [Legionella worsleiensis]|uniref:Uncharacterized protein n=1 Tax=Legionella worsleiensis TaxID=45076 RepID=A0A0W1A9I9_9GAMM|nr:hypothetical protein [Legionella worsleiensis]KTD77993.1 hypothetical protein Lwor_1875 [Legionella worsleiensis]STY31529.1 Uncharacterised protein [Legionella worsleiensis]